MVWNCLTAVCLSYIAVFTVTLESHMKDLAEVLKRLLQACLAMKPTKCKFAHDSVMFLGHGRFGEEVPQ